MTTTRSIAVPLDAGAMTMHVWEPAGRVGPGILLLQEIFGVGPYIRAVAERLARIGYVVGAPDVFWRFAPGWEQGHDADGLSASLEAVGKLDFPTAVADCAAALRALDDDAVTRGVPGVLGFCLGGTLAWAVAVEAEPSLCVSYYGSGVPSMLDGIDRVDCPVLFHFGDKDDYIPNDGVERVAAAIDGRPGFVLNVEHAGHAFDNHESAMFHDEAAARAAWAKTTAFLDEHLPSR